MPGIEIYVNSELPTEFENDFFKGRMLFLLNSVPPDPKASHHRLSTRIRFLANTSSTTWLLLDILHPYRGKDLATPLLELPVAVESVTLQAILIDVALHYRGLLSQVTASYSVHKFTDTRFKPFRQNPLHRVVQRH